jgi:hypothetical protein
MDSQNTYKSETFPIAGKKEAATNRLTPIEFVARQIQAYKDSKKRIGNDNLTQYFTAELNSLTTRALQNENLVMNKINFFLALVTAIGGGLLLASTTLVLKDILLPVGGLVALFLHIMGWATLSQIMDLNSNAIIMYRRMGRVRQWFLDRAPDALPYFPFNPGDDRPKYFIEDAPLRGVETILLMTNAATGGIFSALLWLYIESEFLSITFSRDGMIYLIALGIGAMVASLIWLSQVRYAQRFLRGKEEGQSKNKYVHFPATPTKLQQVKAQRDDRNFTLQGAVIFGVGCLIIYFSSILGRRHFKNRES